MKREKGKNQVSPESRREFLAKAGLLVAGIVASNKTTGRNIHASVDPFSVFKPPEILPDSQLENLGFLNAKKYAKGDGVTDDTVNLRKALLEAQASDLILFLPPGIYLVSGSIDLMLTRGSKGFFIHGNPDERPVIRLKDNCKGFDDESHPGYVLKIWEDAGSWNYNAPEIEGIKEFGAGLMNHASVSSIIIDCGKGNPGAVGFKFWGSQGIYAENITVNAYGALAGIRDLIGNGGYMANLEVFGGKYGVWARNGQPGCIAGLTLIDQEEAAIWQDMGGWPYSVVGFKIVKEKGPAVIVEKATGRNSGQHLSLADGTVELKTKSPAFVINKDSEGRTANLYLRDVYVKNADVLVASSGDESLTAIKGEWSHIHEYCGTSIDWENVIDGKKTGKSVIVDNKKPASNLMTKHMLTREDIPFALDKDTVNVCDTVKMGPNAAKGDGMTDDTAAIRYAIDNFVKVFLPKGEFIISAPIMLKAKTRLFGITSALSRIKTDAGTWKTGTEKVALTTVDDPKASCMAAHIHIYTSSLESATGFKVMEWKAGRNSIVKNVVARPFRDKENEKRLIPVDHLVLITGNGGGRRYGDSIGESYTFPGIAESYRHMVILNSKEPLRFYSYNPEHCCSGSEVEIIDSSNIEIYGVKTESNPRCDPSGSLFIIRGSNNIFLTALGNNGKKTFPGKSLYNIIQCENIALTTIDYLARSRGDYQVLTEERKGSDKIIVPMPMNVGLFRRGEVQRYTP